MPKSEAAAKGPSRGFNIMFWTELNFSEYGTGHGGLPLGQEDLLDSRKGWILGEPFALGCILRSQGVVNVLICDCCKLLYFKLGLFFCNLVVKY